jgi:hypothetical protein
MTREFTSWVICASSAVEKDGQPESQLGIVQITPLRGVPERALQTRCISSERGASAKNLARHDLQRKP